MIAPSLTECAPDHQLLGMGRGAAHFFAACKFYCSCEGLLQVACCNLQQFDGSCDKLLALLKYNSRLSAIR